MTSNLSHISKNLFVLYLAFVLFGSFVPFDFHAVSLHEAIETFVRIPESQTFHLSYSDFAANFLLFIPFAFFLQSFFTSLESTEVPQVVTVFCILAVSFLLAISIEFLQIYFPARTVSRYDILAAVSGSFAGVLLWSWKGERILSIAFEGYQRIKPQTVLQRFIFGFLFIYFFIQVLPLDLTISPVEIYHKWRAGAVVVIPFGTLKSGGWQGLTGPMAGFFIFGLLGYLAVLSGIISGTGTQRFRTALLWGLVISGFAEFLQLFVYSRVSDISDVMSASVGAGIGAMLSKRQQPAIVVGARLDFTRHKWAWSVMIFYAGLLAYYYWQPFDFGLSKSELLGRLQHLLAIPFQSYFNAVGDDALYAFLRQVLFFLPLGIMLYFCLKEWQRADQMLIASFTLFSIAALIELGQLFIASRFADNTDMLIAWLGGCCGFVFPGKIRQVMVRLKPNVANFSKRQK